MPLKTLVARFEVFLARGWFSRRWIIQEVYLSREVFLLCGRDELPWSAFVAVMGLRQKLQYSSTRELARSSAMVLAMSKIHLKDAQFIEVLDYCSYSACEYGKDRLYALMSLATSGRQNFKVDYSPSVSVQEVYISFARSMIEAGSSMLLLTSATRRRLISCQTSALDLPTWVPDRTLQLPGAPLGHIGTTRLKSTLPCRVDKDDQRVLLIDGYFFDNIDCIVAPSVEASRVEPATFQGAVALTSCMKFTTLEGYIGTCRAFTASCVRGQTCEINHRIERTILEIGDTLCHIQTRFGIVLFALRPHCVSAERCYELVVTDFITLRGKDGPVNRRNEAQEMQIFKII